MMNARDVPKRIPVRVIITSIVTLMYSKTESAPKVPSSRHTTANSIALQVRLVTEIWQTVNKNFKKRASM